MDVRVLKGGAPSNTPHLKMRWHLLRWATFSIAYDIIYMDIYISKYQDSLCQTHLVLTCCGLYQGHYAAYDRERAGPEDVPFMRFECGQFRNVDRIKLISSIIEAPIPQVKECLLFNTTTWSTMWISDTHLLSSFTARMRSQDQRFDSSRGLPGCLPSPRLFELDHTATQVAPTIHPAT